MPVYEYRCDHCQHQFEKLQKMAEEPLKICPECRQEKLVKLISASAFHLKGKGWYKTDYKNSPQKNSESDQKTPDSKSDSDTGSAAAPKSNNPVSSNTNTNNTNNTNSGNFNNINNSKISSDPAPKIKPSSSDANIKKKSPPISEKK